MKTFLKNNRQRIEKELNHSRNWPYFSPAIYCQYRVMLPMAQRHAKGDLIDLGCGDMPYRSALISQVITYDGLDLFPRSDQVRYTSNLESMVVISDQTYDTALMIEVLEHVPHPWLALTETWRILKPGGTLIISVPHLSRLHDEPHDYYRYTRHGLRQLLEDSGFEVIELVKKGGIFSFLGHQVSTLILTLTWGIPILRRVVFFLNRWLVTHPCFILDKWLDRGGLAPLGYVATARKV